MRQGGVKNSAYSYNRFMKLIFTLLCLVLSSNVLSADLAYIVSDQAIIYSDMDLSVGIGYVKKGKKIKGCACPSITQDGELAFECYCGNDTRDFRGHKNHADKEKDNSKGRQWGKKDSKFRVEKVEV